MSNQNSLHITGTQINYYFHCHHQLWLFSHQITCEQESDVVYLGKVIHETSYDREKKEIEIDRLKLDFLDIRSGIIHEVKKSESFSHAHQWQVLFYLYYLKQKGVEGFKGEINYPALKKTVQVELTQEKEGKLREVLADIQRIIELAVPPDITVKKTVCRKCSYFELCYI